MPIGHAPIDLENISGPRLSPGYQGEYVILPGNDRSGGKLHHFMAGEEISVAATAMLIYALRGPVADGLVAIRRDPFSRYVETGPIAVLAVDFNSVIVGTVELLHWVLEDPAVVGSVTPAFEYSSDGGASWSAAVTVPASPPAVVPSLFEPDTLDTVDWDTTAVANGVYHLRMTTSPVGSPDIRGPFRVAN